MIKLGNRNGEIEVLGIFISKGVYSDNLTVFIEERAAGIAVGD